MHAYRSLWTTLVTALVGQIEAEANAYAGAYDASFEALEFAHSRGLIDLVWMDRVPVFDPMRADARFTRLRASVAARAKTLEDVLRLEGLD
jgi:hypothetical protein